MKIIEMLRLSEAGFSQRDIAASVGCSKSTVQEAEKRCKASGLNYDKAKGMSDSEIDKELYPASSGGRPKKKTPDFQAIEDKRNEGKRRNVEYAFADYRQDHPDGLSRSQFYARYNEWRATTGKDVVMVQEREPGKELFTDWMGDTLPCVLDSETGKLLKAHFYVGTLGDSGYPYAEAFPDESEESWLLAHIHNYRYLGGVPEVEKPDNLKTGVTKSDRYDPVLNQAYRDLTVYYGVAVIPARVRKPRDKAQVESSVGWLETWLLEKLRGEIFMSFAELNRAVMKRLAELVKKPYQKRAGCRESAFIEIDKPHLRALPPEDYEIAQYVTRTVPDNYHVQYAGFYYSVPFTYYRQKVTLKAAGNIIEIYDSDRKRIAVHERRYTGSRYVTLPAHMPKNHQFVQDMKQFSGERYRSWAKAIGENTYAVIDQNLRMRDFEEQGYKACMGILQMSKTCGNVRLEAACAKALLMGSATCTTVKNILKNKQEAVPLSGETAATAAHGNIRGAQAFG
jgi:transposase